jgi:predicted RNA-binding Zn-ribbon protein involved in translation (DUF1610 family)
MPCAAMALAQHAKVSLKVVDPPRRVLEAPPTLVASSHTIDFTCGGCGVVLLHAEHRQVHGLLIRCKECGAYNAIE